MIWANGFQFWASRLLISRLTFQHLSLLPLSLNLRLDIFYLLSQPSGPVNLQQFKKNVCSYCIILFSIVFPIWLIVCSFAAHVSHTFHTGFTPGGFRLALQLSLKVVGKVIDQAVQIAGLFSHLSVLFLGVLPNFPAWAAWAFPLQEISKKWSRFMSFDAFRLKVSNSFFISDSCKSTKFSTECHLGFLPQSQNQAKSAPDFAPMSVGPSLPAVLRCFRPSCPLLPWPSQAPDSPPGIEAIWMAMLRTGTGPHSNSIIRWKKTWENMRKSSENGLFKWSFCWAEFRSLSKCYEWRIWMKNMFKNHLNREWWHDDDTATVWLYHCIRWLMTMWGVRLRLTKTLTASTPIENSEEFYKETCIWSYWSL